MADELTRVYNTLAYLNFYKKLRVGSCSINHVGATAPKFGAIAPKFGSYSFKQANRRFAYGRDYARESKKLDYFLSHITLKGFYCVNGRVSQRS